MSTIVVQVKLSPPRQAVDSLVSTLRRCNEAANYVADVAWQRRIFRQYDLHKVTYGHLRQELGLGSQASVHIIKKVAGAYNSGDLKFRRTRERHFRWSAAQPFDARNLTWNLDAQTVSIWSVDGRLKSVAFACAEWQMKTLTTGTLKECDLLYRNGSLYLYASVEVEDEPMNEDPAGFIGVDLGIVNIATTSTGKNFSGTQMNHQRRENNVRRARLQQKGTRSSTRRLIKESGREARFAANVNHAIAKEIVAEAQRTGQGIALEELEGILARARSRKPQWVTLRSWSFHQLGAFIAYKAKIAGVAVVHVDPAYTSQQCAKCGRIAKENRPARDTFCCIRCGWSLPADENASLNIAQRGVEVWAVSHAAERNTLLAV